MTSRKTLYTAGGLGLALVGRGVLSRVRVADLQGQVAVVTGGSRGLGLLLAREFARQGCRVVICARDEAELGRARAYLERETAGVEVLTVVCDVSDRAQVERLISAATARFGQVDILVNNAGIITVGPIQNMTLDDFENSMDIIYWGGVYATLAVLPSMLERGAGRIVNIGSVGGKVSVPHLLPYSAAKFAAVGFSEGLRAELAGTGVTVTTIAPGLMRTGSPLNAFFAGRQEGEFAWFAAGDSLAFVSMDAERAARQIVAAARRGQAEKILSLPALLSSLFHGLFPGTTSNLLGLVNRLILPKSTSEGAALKRGMDVHEGMDSRLLDAILTWTTKAAERFNEHPGPLDAPAQGAHAERHT